MPNDEFGDFQTPIELARRCLARLPGFLSVSRVLEPTCGQGSFLQAASELSPSAERIGIEIQPEYVARAAEFGTVLQQNVFSMDLLKDVSWSVPGPLMVVGNPPWVTSAELNKMDSDNLPKKENFKGAKGLDAMLGSSNFDVCEYIVLKVMAELAPAGVTIGMLCKTQVARNIVEYAASASLPLHSSAIYHIDAKEWFNAAVDACWFVAEIDAAKSPSYVTSVFDSLDSEIPVRSFGVVDGRFVADVGKYMATKAADGVCPYEWRSGLKHDASSVFELVAAPEPTTKAGNQLDLEPGFVFPLLKCTDIFRGRHATLSKWVIVPQMTFGAETKHLEWTAPKLWTYLTANAAALDGRKSSIYRNRPRFSVFGHGPYTFAPYKVAVSGLHKKPIFRLVLPLNGQPVVLDDTCYLLAFDDLAEAVTVWALLMTKECQDLIESLVFWDSKRPLTKKLLARLDLFRLPVDPQGVITAGAEMAASAGLSVTPEEIDAALARLMGEQAVSAVGTLF
jgi:hypothetical protein